MCAYLTANSAAQRLLKIHQEISTAQDFIRRVYDMLLAIEKEKDTYWEEGAFDQEKLTRMHVLTKTEGRYIDSCERYHEKFSKKMPELLNETILAAKKIAQTRNLKEKYRPAKKDSIMEYLELQSKKVLSNFAASEKDIKQYFQAVQSRVKKENLILGALMAGESHSKFLAELEKEKMAERKLRKKIFIDTASIPTVQETIDHMKSTQFLNDAIKTSSVSGLVAVVYSLAQSDDALGEPYIGIIGVSLLVSMMIMWMIKTREYARRENFFDDDEQATYNTLHQAFKA